MHARLSQSGGAAPEAHFPGKPVRPPLKTGTITVLWDSKQRARASSGVGAKTGVTTRCNGRRRDAPRPSTLAGLAGDPGERFGAVKVLGVGDEPNFEGGEREHGRKTQRGEAVGTRVRRAPRL